MLQNMPWSYSPNFSVGLKSQIVQIVLDSPPPVNEDIV
jgi:hypothetical protein